MPITQDDLIEAGVQHGLIDSESIASLRVESRKLREPLVEVVARHHRFPVSALYRAVANLRGLTFVDLGTTKLDEKLASRLPDALLRRARLVPVGHVDGAVLLATLDPDDRAAIETAERVLDAPAHIAMCDPEGMTLATERLLRVQARQNGRALASSASAGAIETLDRVLNQAFVRRASDVHLEPCADGLQVRLRIDGRLQTYISGLQGSAAHEIVSRVKVLAGLDIAEQRAPQDGRTTFRPNGHEHTEIDIRVATAPTRWGERATLRFLGTDSDDLSLERLGMSPNDLAMFEQVIRRPYGIVLLTGPTGSGKTTTLYAALREINQPHLNIMTVEDPIEYLVDGVSQMHIGGTDKVTFASALRSLLRHDPDVLMVGEIRDQETADVAIKSAMTGHLLFSTLHTNSALGAVSRLVDIGCEPYLIGATLSAVVSQRLVRRLCSACKVARPATEKEQAALDVDTAVEIFEPVGCPRCLGSGYYNRIGLFECLWVDRSLARLISSGTPESDLAAHCRDSLKTLRRDGVEKVLSGATSLQEVLETTLDIF